MPSAPKEITISSGRRALLCACLFALIPCPAKAQSVRPGWGSTPYADAGGTGVTFRTWAPNATSVSVAGEFNGWNTLTLPLTHEGGGVWSRDVSTALVGQPYKYVINGNLWRRDPYGRTMEPAEFRNSLIYDTTAFDWTGDDFTIPPANEMVIYEMHIGTFGATSGGNGTFTGAMARLDHLVDLGINAVELMPVNEFPTSTSWGYNQSYPYSIEARYGTPDELKAFVKACHERGIAVLIDVVHNHYGDDFDDWSLWQYDGWHQNDYGGIFFYNAADLCCTPWGPRPDFSRVEVRNYIIDNFRMWKDEFRIDGFRWDAPKFILFTDGSMTVPIPDGLLLIDETLDMLAAEYPDTLNIAEDVKDVSTFDSHWDTGYQFTLDNFMRFGDQTGLAISGLANAINSEPHRIIFTESHDTTGNLNGGQRIPTRINNVDSAGYDARKRSTLGAVLTLTAPGTPMIWQGQEMLETNQFSDIRPVDWSRTNTFAGITRLYRDAIHLRRNLDGVSGGLLGDVSTVLYAHNTHRVLAYRRASGSHPGQDVYVIANLSDEIRHAYTLPFPEEGAWYVHLNTDSVEYGEDYEGIGPISVVASGSPPTATLDIGRHSVLVLSKVPRTGLVIETVTVTDHPQGNQDGIIDPGEIIHKTVTLFNKSQAAASNVTAILSSPNPSVIFLQSVADYPVLDPDAPGSNAAPFSFLVDTTTPCGILLEFHIATLANGQTITNVFFHRVGDLVSAGTSTGQYESADVPINVPSNQTTFSHLTIPEDAWGPIQHLAVSVRINHTWNSDMVIALQHPDGTEVILSNRRGGSGDNFGSGDCAVGTRTRFDSSAATPISAGSSPFLGSFRPDGNLTNLSGKLPAGTWRLRITEHIDLDQGALLCWGIEVTAPQLTTACTPHDVGELDADGDGIPDWWEDFYFGGPTNAVAHVDADGDGYTVWEEFRMGTHPNDPASHLRLIMPGEPTENGLLIRWASVGARFYRILRTENLQSGFTDVIADGIPATPPSNTHIDTTATGSGPHIYRVELE